MMLIKTLATLVLSLSTLTALAAPVVDAPSSLVSRSPTGRGTWYDVGLGACGKTNKNSQPIIAMNGHQYKKSLCGKWITIHCGKKSQRGYIMDLCPGCPKYAADLSPSLFKKFAPLGKGVIKISFTLPKTKRDLVTARNATAVEDGDDDEFDYDNFPDELAATSEDLEGLDDEELDASAIPESA